MYVSEKNSSTVVTATDNRLEGFSTEDYIKKVSSELKPIQSCKNEYEAQIKKLAETTSSRIDYSDCEFKPIDKINNISLLGLVHRTKPSEDEVVEEFEKINKNRVKEKFYADNDIKRVYNPYLKASNSTSLAINYPVSYF